jgi:GNAT superfamily N-acetyltransferase
MLFKKLIKVWIDSYESLVLIKLTIDGVSISKIQCIKYPDDSLLIGDIEPFQRERDYGKGYGSMMMDELLKYAFQYGIHTIRGNLAIVDSDHKERLHAFYRKHGFEIVQYNTNKDSYYGEVLKKL